MHIPYSKFRESLLPSLFASRYQSQLLYTMNYHPQNAETDRGGLQIQGAMFRGKCHALPPKASEGKDSKNHLYRLDIVMG